MRHDPQNVVGIGGDDVVAGHPRLEAERRALDRRRNVGRTDIGQHVGDVLGVAGAFLRAPVRFVDLFLHNRSLEGAIGKGVDGVQIHVVVAEEFFELVALDRAVDERVR